jgi:hypothetical protein
MIDRFQAISRLLQFLYIQRVKGLSPPSDEPYMPPAEVARFKYELSKARHYVEFGSGGSTVYASQQGVKTISVENDRFYARVVAKGLHQSSVKQLVVDMGITGEWGMPIFPNPRKARRYICAPWDVETFPQFILVDGRYRVACALESARRARLVGQSAVLMFDDYEVRSSYHQIEQILGVPEKCGRAAIFDIGSQQVELSVIDHWLNDPL